MALKDILPGTLGFGAAPLGNMFRDIPEQEALGTVEAAWDDGIRYFDNAPFYGAGLAEIRMGESLAGRPRDEYVISTKVGRVILDEIEDVSARDLGEKGDVFRYGRPNKIVNDYSYDATLRSIEDSLKRLKTDRIEIAFVHDVAQDFYGDEWLDVFETARKGAFKALDRLRDEGVIKAWGLGVNRVEPIELLLALEGPRPDGFLLAGRYTLLDHDRALQRVMPVVAERGLGIIVGGPYSSGALVGGPNFEYAPATPAILAKVARIKAIADRHGISMKAAGLQFALANPAVAAVIPGASQPSRIAEDRAALNEVIPSRPGQSRRSPADSLSESVNCARPLSCGRGSRYRILRQKALQARHGKIEERAHARRQMLGTAIERMNFISLGNGAVGKHLDELSAGDRAADVIVGDPPDPDACHRHAADGFAVIGQKRAAQHPLDDPPALAHRPDGVCPAKIEPQAIMPQQILRRFRHAPPGEIGG